MNRLWQYILHLRHAKGIFWIHSPFVFGLYERVFRAKTPAETARFEELRRALAADNTLLEIEDFGAGFDGNAMRHIQKSVATVAKRSARRKREGDLLYLLCRELQPKRCLEFGTNLGISTLYQMAALAPDAEWHTMEGSAALAEIAQRNFRQFGIQPIVHIGEFSQILSELLIDKKPFDYVFIDGNHRYAPTIAYFEQLLPHIADGGCIVFDDIYWSEEMRTAWREIAAHPAVSVSLDVYYMGIVFVRRPQRKEHFLVRY